MKRAVIYGRVSTGLQVEGTSLETQEKACRRKAEDMQAEIVEVACDPGVSGARYITRPGIQSALTALRSGKADTLIVYKMDRAGRDAGILRQIRKEVQRLKCDLIFADGMNFANDATGNLMFTQLSGFAEFERDLITERTSNGRKALAASGVQPSRTMPPFGFHIVTKSDKIEGKYPEHRTGDYVEIEAQSRWVRTIFHLFAEGKSLRHIAAYLNDHGVQTSKGGRQWWPSGVRKILENPVFCGKVVYGKTQTIADESMTHLNDPTRILKSGKRAIDRPEAEWTQVATIPAIVDMQTWQACAAALSENMEEKQSRNGGNPARRYMLSGLVFCTHCGRRISGGRDKRTKPHFYVCVNSSDCPAYKRSYRAEVLEGLVLTALLYLHSEPASIRDAIARYDAFQRDQEVGGGQEAERLRLQSLLRDIEADLSHMKAAMLEGMRNGLTAADFAGEMKAISDRRAAIEERLQATAPTNRQPDRSGILNETAKLAAIASAIVKVFSAPPEDFSPAEKRALLLPIVERIVPDQDGEGIQVIWRTGTVHQFLIKCTVSNKSEQPIFMSVQERLAA